MNMTMVDGTPLYMAPETFIDGDCFYDFSVDVYSYEFILYRMFLNIILFDDKKKICNYRQYLMKIGRGRRLIKLDNIAEHYWDLISKCWKHDPQSRPTFDEIVEILKDDKFAI